MPIPSPGNYDNASQTTLLAVKARTDFLGGNTHIPLYLLRGKVIQGTWAFVANAAVSMYRNDLVGAGIVAGYMTNTSAALNDEYDYPGIFLSAGDYYIEVIHGRQPNPPNSMTIFFGATSIGVIDMGNGANTFNNIDTLGFTVAVDAIAPIRIAHNDVGKSGQIQAITIWRA